MFKSLTSKIFCSFAILILVEVGIVAYFSASVLIRESEVHVFDALSQRSRIKALEVEILIQQNPSYIKEELYKQYQMIAAAPTLSIAFQTPFAIEEIKSILPAAGSVVTPCKSLDHKLYLCAATQLPTLNAWIFDWTPQTTLISVFKRLVSELLLLAAVSSIVALIFAFFIARLLTQPLKKFANASYQVSRGEFDDVNLPIFRSDEVGDLAKSFSSMAHELKMREQNLKLSTLKVAHSERLASIGVLGASIAHELKNPLTAISGYSKILNQKVHEEELKEAADIIQKETQRCQDILQQILRFTRNDPLEKRPYALKEVLQSVFLLLKAEARQKQVTLKLEKLNDELVMGSAQQIQQVFLNLLMNAIQASKSGGEVIVRMRQEASQILVEIEDHGAGIPKAVQSKIFDPFFTTKTSGEGTGLGLSVSRDIVVSQNGVLSFESEEGKGTTFRVQFPLA